MATTNDVLRYAQVCSASTHSLKVANICFAESGYRPLRSVDNPHTSTTAHLLDGRDEYVIVFKPSKEIRDWVTNFSFYKDPVPWWSTGKMHQGFLEAFESVMLSLLEPITKPILDGMSEQKRIILTGHSLGGALANVCAAYLSTIPVISDLIEVITFGAPRVFDTEAAATYDVLIESTRIEVAGDLICRVPKPFMGFRHVGVHKYFDLKGVLHTNPSKTLVLRDTVMDWLTELSGDWIKFEDHKLSLYIQRIKKYAN